MDFKAIALKIFSKKTIARWIAPAIFALIAAAAGMQTDEFKTAVCGAPSFEEVK